MVFRVLPEMHQAIKNLTARTTVADFARAIRDAYRFHKEQGYVPWGSRFGLALVFVALFVFAGLASEGRSHPFTWVMVGFFSLSFLGLVVAGIWMEVQEAVSRARRGER